MARLYKRPDSEVWYAVFRSTTGKLVRRSTGLAHREQAERVLRAWQLDDEREHADRAAGIERPSDVTLETLAGEYLLSMQAERSKNHVEGSLLQLAVRFLPYFGPQTLARSLRASDIEQFRAALLRGTAEWKPVRAATANRCISIVRRMFDFGVRFGHLRANPAARLRKLKERTEQRHRALTHNEVEMLLTELARSRQEHKLHRVLWVRFLLETGLRAGEASALTWSDIRTLSDVSVVHVRASTAKDAERRDVPLSNQAQSVLDELRAQRKSAVGLVFGPCRHRTALEEAWSRTGLPGRAPSPHDFRHTFASWAVQAGLSLTDLRALLGHKSVSTTERYLHTYGDTLGRVAALLNRRG